MIYILFAEKIKILEQILKFYLYIFIYYDNYF